jgi:hypothetical protein
MKPPAAGGAMKCVSFPEYIRTPEGTIGFFLSACLVEGDALNITACRTEGLARVVRAPDRSGYWLVYQLDPDGIFCLPDEAQVWQLQENVGPTSAGSL